ncbi:hypothetical protein TWF506_000081 [Arthrobotrys conoides]|uniref:F-box domain-containing protein n=1 Tax=Arthrobotrys conoides TaxID=74498 RepID=A0AAN8P7P8_9PEZI
MSEQKAAILLLPMELQIQILSYLPFLDQIHCMCIAPVWYTILQQEDLKDVRYYSHIYPSIHRLTFEEDLEIDLRVVKGLIEAASIWKRPAPFKNKQEYLLGNIDLKSDQTSVLSERLFRDDFSGFAKEKISQVNVSLIEVILVAFTSNDPNARSRGPWKRRWLLSEQLDTSFERMSILDLLQFTTDVVAASHSLAAENLVTVRFVLAGWKRRRLDVVINV